MGDTANRCATLAASYSKIEAAIGAKGASTKYWAKAVNTHTCDFYLFIYKTLQRFQTNFFHFFILG